ncbi:L,D-transpeptidase [Pseudorhizobium halotolerans]|uniref:L,D-transpeptidase n=2 Tax=Pseudorhizobium halotolerans TaxID=1233081 RepID=A0ABM8PUL0_9HYPH|nr:L,D-transpeptidase [Pseudorhizobium halotolerans]
MVLGMREVTLKCALRTGRTMTFNTLCRRSLAFLILVAPLSACTTYSTQPAPPPVVAAAAFEAPVEPEEPKDPAVMYGERLDHGFQIAAVDVSKLPDERRRQEVDYATTEAPGTVVVDQSARYLYFVMPEGRAMRYSVAVGPASRNFTGEAIIDRKAAWPRWTPTDSMIKRSPEHYGRFKDGVDGGPSNPMGARALYIQKDGVDTYYRVHGTNDPSSIGKAVSAGCIRLLNQDVMDLYERVNIGARIVVL